MMKEKKLILDKAQIVQKIRRIAYEIYEQNYAEDGLVIAGIDDMGYKLSELILKEIKKIAKLPCHLVRIDIDKEASSQPSVQFSHIPKLKDLVVIIVDDVLNSGRTLIYALDPFLKADVAKIQTAVLVNRSHNKFPIAVDYKGYELGTTIQDHIEVKLTATEYSAHIY